MNLVSSNNFYGVLPFLILFTYALSVSLPQDITSISDSNISINTSIIDDDSAVKHLLKLDPGWGYNYDSLLLDVARWRNSPYVKIDSAGASVQNRALWLLTLTDTAEFFESKFRISIHARTHPNEVPSFYMTRKMIEILITDSPLSRKLRKNCIFHIMPMYNPDGVELGYGRENANHIDLERNWDKDPMEPESAVLKNLFLSFMFSESPVRIALNMHADAGGSKRYFVYHHENGTSIEYTKEEKLFITGVKSYWPEGIADWDSHVTWVDGTPTYYPESWWWFNFGIGILALTHEEIPAADENDYYRSADALLNGIAEYLGIEDNISIRELWVSEFLQEFSLSQNYPNPFNAATTIEYSIPNVGARRALPALLKVFDVLGNEVSTLVNGEKEPGIYKVKFNAGNLASGLYFYRLQSGEFIETKRMLLIK